jgi:hypothetical protein
LFITITILVYHYYTNTKDRPCISPPYISPPLYYKPIKNRLRKNISPGLNIVGGLRYRRFKVNLHGVNCGIVNGIDGLETH